MVLLALLASLDGQMGLILATQRELEERLVSETGYLIGKVILHCLT